VRCGVHGHALFTLAEIGITKNRGTKDSAVLRHARDAGCIVITGNRSDFAVEMRNAAKLCTPTKCCEGGGMITVPNGVPSFPFGKISTKLTLNEKPVWWSDVFTCNLHVAVNRDGFAVRPLPLCDFFRNDHEGCEICVGFGIVPTAYTV
jgi:hypothetical protein